MINLGNGQTAAPSRFNLAAAAVAGGGVLLLFALLAWMAPPSPSIHASPPLAVQVVYVSPELFANLPPAADPAVAPPSGEPVAGAPEPAPGGPAPTPEATARTEPSRPRSVQLARLPGPVVEPARTPTPAAAEPPSTAPRALQLPPPSTPTPAPVAVAAATPAPQPAVTVPVERPEPEQKGETRGPRVLKYVQPVYPSIARSQRIGGTVVVEITVGDDGTVEDATVLQSPSPLLHQSAVEAAKKMRFEPALSNGRPIRAKFSQPFTFKLSQ